MSQIPPPPTPIKRLLPTESQGLAASMHLSRSVDERNLYCNLVENVAKLYDKHEQRMAGVHVGSCSKSWKWFLGEVVQEMGPELIESYEAAWPVAVIVREHRARKCDRRRSVNPGLASWTKHMVKNATPGRQKKREGVPITERTNAGLSEPYPPRLPSVFRVDSSEAESRITPRGGTTLGPNIQTTEIAPADGQWALDKPKPMAKSKPGSVLGFLKSLNPPQPNLLPLFVEKGVVSMVDLDELARMTPWLYGWVKEARISEFQFEVIRKGLINLLE